jgi:hypothetical protein
MYFAMLLFWTTILLAVVVSFLTKPVPEYRVSEIYSAFPIMTDHLNLCLNISFPFSLETVRPFHFVA